jgi:hypothetical protein
MASTEIIQQLAQSIANCDSNDGFSNQAVAGPDTIDREGNSIAEGTPVINFYNAEGEYVNSCVKSGDSSITPNDEGEGGGLGTATITQTDGSVKDDVVCGVQSTVTDLENGSVDVVQYDGTKCAVSAINPVKKDGSNYAKGDRPKFVDLDALEDPERGFVAKIEHESGGLCVTYCDNSVDNYAPNTRCTESTSSFGTAIVTSDTPSNAPLEGMERCINVNSGKCAQLIDLTYQYSWSRRSISPPEAGGRTSFLPQISCDGGATWAFIRTGGGDQIHGGVTMNKSVTALTNGGQPTSDDINDDIVNYGFYEQQFEDRICCNMPAGVNPICVRVYHLTNLLDPGTEMIANATTLSARSLAIFPC